MNSFKKQESNTLLNQLLKNDNDCKFSNNDNDSELEDVMKFVFGENIPEPRPLKCADGQTRIFTFDE